MHDIINFIKQNISWTKDLFTLIFTAVATLIGILTYNRAKATVLQPIRSEVIKRQSQILTELLDFLYKENSIITKDDDYIEIVKLNVVRLLNYYWLSYEIKSEDERPDNEDITGFIYCGNGNNPEDLNFIAPADYNNTDAKKVQDYNKSKRIELLKQGIYKVDYIFLNRRFYDFYNRLKEYTENPFLPVNIQEPLRKIVSDINDNLTIKLRSVLTVFLESFCTEYFNGHIKQNISTFDTYNKFARTRVFHDSELKILNENIRKYLMIDDKWI